MNLFTFLVAACEYIHYNSKTLNGERIQTTKEEAYMKNQLNLVELAQQIENLRSAKRDFIADTRKLHMSMNGKDMVLLPEDAPSREIEAAERLPVEDIAHDQIAERLQIPAKYYNRMRKESPELLSVNVNHWFSENPEKRMVRTLGGNVRAFLSDRYQRIENEHIAEMVLPELLGAKDKGVEIVSCAITQTKMYIKAVYKHIEGEVRAGDVVQSGVVISNSEVGHGAVNIQPLIYRCVCDNGMIIEDSKYTRHHVGGRISSTESIYHLLSDETVRADDRAVLLKVRDVVRASFDEVVFARQLDAMRTAAGEPLRGNPVEAIKVLSNKFSLQENESQGILGQLLAAGDMTRWGMLNAVTRHSQDVESYERATELETIGGRILAMRGAEWKPIAEAA